MADNSAIDVVIFFFVIDVANELELLELLGRNILDSCKVESHPIVSFEDLFAFFERHPP